MHVLRPVIGLDISTDNGIGAPPKTTLISRLGALQLQVRKFALRGGVSDTSILILSKLGRTVHLGAVLWCSKTVH